MIQKVKDGYQVLSEKGNNLGGPYKTVEEAKKRLAQVEYFKHVGKKAQVEFSKRDKDIVRFLLPQSDKQKISYKYSWINEVGDTTIDPTLQEKTTLLEKLKMIDQELYNLVSDHVKKKRKGVAQNIRTTLKFFNLFNNMGNLND